MKFVFYLSLKKFKQKSFCEFNSVQNGIDQFVCRLKIWEAIESDSINEVSVSK